MKTIEQNKTCKVNCETKGEMAREFNAALDAQRRLVNSLIRKGRFSSGIPDGVVKEDDTSHASCPLDGGSHWKFLHDLRVAGSCPLRRTEDANGCRVFGDNGLYSFRADDGNVHIHARGVCMTSSSKLLVFPEFICRIRGAFFRATSQALARHAALLRSVCPMS